MKFSEAISNTAEGSAKRTTALRKVYGARRAEAAALRDDPGAGRIVVQRLSRLTDSLLRALFRAAVAAHGGPKDGNRAGISLLAVGGYGRAELNPYSDVDLLFLFGPGTDAETAEAVARYVLYPLWDLHLVVGHSVRTVADCITVGLEDLSARTCMMESRLLMGDAALYDTFCRTYITRVARKGADAYVRNKIEEQRSRHSRFGETVFLQQPNVKESPGGLRDIQHLGWIAGARYGVGELKVLAQRGILDAEDYAKLIRAQGFLWRIRNDMHFEYDKAVDVLTFEEQLRISGRLNFVDTRQRRGVERFMRRYFLHAARVLDICTRFNDRVASHSRRRSLKGILLSRKVAPWFTLSSREIRVDADRLNAFRADGAAVVHLFHLAQIHGLTIEADTAEFLSHNAPDGRSLQSREAGAELLKILGWGTGVAETLGHMHRLGILGRVLPEFRRVERLVTFSLYHKYTVDAHSLNAISITQGLRDEDTVYGQVYRQIRRKELLTLAVLLHDAGKGRSGNHCETGANIAHMVGTRMGLSRDEIDLVAFLVREHLYMTGVAFRRDLSDPEVLGKVTRQIQTPERLQMLFVLTHVDVRAVGPDTWNSYKDGLLTELYARALESLAGRRLVVDRPRAIAAIRKQVERELGDAGGPWADEIMDQAPGRYLETHSVVEIARHIQMVRKMDVEVVQVDVTPDAPGTTEITVCAHDDRVKNMFSRVVGTLTAKDLAVLDARITTFRDDVVLDVFRVRNPEDSDVFDAPRWERLRATLTDVLLGKTSVESLFAGGHGHIQHQDIQFSDTAPVVRVDNDTSKAMSIIDIFAADRQGLLYTITRTLAELKLHIFFSRIGTRADQAVDVFYVKNAAGEKLGPEEADRVRDRLMAVISNHKGVAA